MKKIVIFFFCAAAIAALFSQSITMLDIDYAGCNNDEPIFWGVEAGSYDLVLFSCAPVSQVTVVVRLALPDSLVGQVVKNVVAFNHDLVSVLVGSSIISYDLAIDQVWTSYHPEAVNIKNSGQGDLVVVSEGGYTYYLTTDLMAGGQLSPTSNLTETICFDYHYQNNIVSVGGSIFWGSNELAALKIFFSNTIYSPRLFVTANYNKVVDLVIDSDGNIFAAVLEDVGEFGRIGVIRFSQNTFVSEEIWSQAVHYPAALSWIMIPNSNPDGGVYLAGGTSLSKITANGQETSMFISTYGNNIQGLISLQDGRLVILLENGIEILDNSVQTIDNVIINSPNGLINYPNPFNLSTTIVFTLRNPEEVTLDVYNVKGQRVTTLLSGNLISGRHSIVWNGIDQAGEAVSSGVYFARIISKQSYFVRRMILMK